MEKPKLGGQSVALWRRRPLLIGVGLLLGVGAVLLVSYLFSPYLRGSPKDREEETKLQQLLEAANRQPENAGLRVELAQAYAERGKFEQAIAQAEQALSLQENRQDALITLGNIYMAQKSYSKAVEPYLKVVDLNKDNPLRFASQELEAVHYYLGMAYLAMNQPESALRYLQGALEIDRTDADALYLLGRAHQHLGQHQEAVAAFQGALSFAPAFREAYEGLVISYDRVGLAQETAYARAMVIYTSGDYFQAARQLQEVVNSKPDFAEAYLGLGLAYEKTGNDDKAREAYQKALELKPTLWLANARIEILKSR